MKEEHRISIVLRKPKHEMILCLVLIVLIGIARIWVAELRATTANMGYLDSRNDISGALASCATDFERLCIAPLHSYDDTAERSALDCTLASPIRMNPYLRNVVQSTWCHPHVAVATNKPDTKLHIKLFTARILHSVFLGRRPICFGIVGGYCAVLFESVRDLLTRNTNGTDAFDGLFPLQGYDEKLVDEAMDEAVQEFLDAELAGLRKALHNIVLESIDSPAPPARDPLPPIPTFLLSSFSNGEAMLCLREHYNQNKRLTLRCEQMVQEATEKLQNFEFRWDFPLAHMLMYLYVILAAVSLHRLGLPLGQPETARSRKRRQFVQMLQDPVLRRHMENRAEQQKEKCDIAKYMEELDAKAAQFVEEDAMTDIEWKQQEAKREAWKNTIAFMWISRRGCGAAALLSLVLLLVDSPAAVQVLDGLLVVAIAFLGTYFCLPANPVVKELVEQEEDPKDYSNNALAEPLL